MTDTIFMPRFEATKKLDDVVESIATNGWLIENMLIMPRHETWFRRDVQISRAAATTRIEGATLDEEDVSALVRRGHGGRLTEDEQANLNAISAYEFVDYLSDQADIPINELVIRQLNREFLSGSSEALTPGVYRKGHNKVGEKFSPPDQGDVPGLMREFSAWLEEEDEIGPVAKAALAHVQLVAIHPFWDGNGRTARALATLILQRSSRFAFKKLLAIETFFFYRRDDYFTAIERTLGRSYTPDYDAMPFVELFASSLMAQSIELVERLTKWHRRMEDVHEAMKRLNLNNRQADVLAFANQMGKVTRSDYLEITGTSPVTASRDLADLVKKGWLKSEGRTRSRVYFTVPLVREQGEPPAEQPRLLDRGDV